MRSTLFKRDRIAAQLRCDNSVARGNKYIEALENETSPSYNPLLKNPWMCNYNSPGNG